MSEKLFEINYLLVIESNLEISIYDVKIHKQNVPNKMESKAHHAASVEVEEHTARKRLNFH